MNRPHEGWYGWRVARYRPGDRFPWYIEQPIGGFVNCLKLASSERWVGNGKAWLIPPDVIYPGEFNGFGMYGEGD